MARTNDSDVFLSYRRANRKFALQLDEALRAQGLEVWIDTEDILPGVDHFGTEIEDGILGADIFVPVFSPDFFESPYCINELNFAIENGKRVIPIIYKPLSDFSKIPSQAGEVNWVYFCPFHEMQNTFEEAFPNLMDAIHLDEDYIKSHTEYLRRAKLWEEKEKHADFLLSGEEVAIAYQWLTTPTTGNHQVTPVQQDFIQKSHELQEKVVAEQKRQLAEKQRLLEEKQKLVAQQLEDERKLARRQRSLLIVTYGGLIALLFGISRFVNTVSGNSDERVRNDMIEMVSAAESLVDTELMLTMAQTNDEAENERLRLQHQENLDLVESYYPFTSSYTLFVEDEDDFKLLATSDVSLTNTIEGTDYSRIESPEQVVAYFEDSTIKSQLGFLGGFDPFAVRDYFILGQFDLYDDEIYVGSLFMEEYDPISETQNTLEYILLILRSILVLVVVFYVLKFARRKILALFKRDKLTTPKQDKDTVKPTTA